MGRLLATTTSQQAWSSFRALFPALITLKQNQTLYNRCFHPFREDNTDRHQRGFVRLHRTAVIYGFCCLLPDQDNRTVLRAEDFSCRRGSAARTLRFIFQNRIKQEADFPPPDWLGRLASLQMCKIVIVIFSSRFFSDHETLY